MSFPNGRSSQSCVLRGYQQATRINSASKTGRPGRLGWVGTGPMSSGQWHGPSGRPARKDNETGPDWYVVGSPLPYPPPPSLCCCCCCSSKREQRGQIFYASITLDCSNVFCLLLTIQINAEFYSAAYGIG